jgi:hypothetical protein
MTQRKLTALRIGNFKAFADTQRIPLKPITLIFGPNSAGKSSIVHSLAFAHQVQLGRAMHSGAPLDVHATEIGGASIELGGFRQFVHRRDASRRVTWGADLAVASLDKRLRELLTDVRQVSLIIGVGIELDDQGRAMSGKSPRVDSAEILADGEELLHMSRRASREGTARMRVDRLASSHHVWRAVTRAIIESSTTATTFTDEDFAHIDRAIADLLPQLDIRCPRLFPDGVELRGASDESMPLGELLVPVGRGTRPEDIARALHIYLPTVLNEFVDGVSRSLDGELGALRYLGPVRERPTRHAMPVEHRDANWFAGGGFAWDVLVQDEGIRERVNEWLEGHPAVPRTEARIAAMRNPDTPTNWKKLYRLIVDRYSANTELRDALEAAFFERPLTLLQRRELLTKSLVQVFAELQEQYETDQARAEKYAKELEPWIQRIQAAQSTEEADRILAEAMAHFEAEEVKRLESPEEQRNVFQELEAEDAPMEAALKRAADFMTALDKRGVPTIKELRLQEVDEKLRPSGAVVALCDVGFGISQVLPVLTLAYANQGDLIAIEQPEIHLHPALQAELGDVFIESALGQRQNTFILETHSEHLILRVMRRMRETWQKKSTGLPPITPDDVSILYVEPASQGLCSIVREMPLNEAGQLVKAWPGGFFEEGLREQFGDA